MKRLINLFTMLLISICVNAQNYKILKVGGIAPKSPKGKVYKVGDVISKASDINWPEDDSWLKVLSLDKRKVIYLSPAGESSKKSGLVGNSELSCKTTYLDSEAYTSPFVEVGQKCIPQSFNCKNGEISPNQISLLDVELDDKDEICMVFYDKTMGGYQFRRIPLIKNGDIYSFQITNGMFSEQPKGTGIYLSFYLVHNNNYALIKNNSTIWF